MSRASYLKIFPVIALAFTVQLSFAQERTLTLQEAITLTLKNSYQLKASDARIQQAIAAVKGATDNRLPNASVSGSYLRLSNADISLKTNKPSGSSDSSGSSFPKVNQAAYGIANISLPIFTGGKIKYGIESARYLEEATKLDAIHDRQSVIYNTINAYVNLYKASATALVVKENLEASRHRDSVFLRLENNGLLARNDRLKAQLQTSQIELSLLDLMNNQKLAMINLNLMMGLPEETILVTDSTGFQLPNEIESILELQQTALQNRNDLKAMKQRIHAAETGISLSRADLYPSLALTGGYMAAYIPKVLTVTNAINVGIGLKYDIGSLWKTKSKVEMAKSKLAEVQANDSLLQNSIKLSLHKDFEQYLLSRKKILVYQNAVEQSEENFRITQNKYNNSLVNTTELLEANVLMLQSKINLAVAKADEYLAYSKLLETTGNLSE